MTAYPDAAALLRDLRALGVHLERRGDKLHYRAPAGTVTDGLRGAMVERKAALLALLDVGKAAPPTSPVASKTAPGVTCPACGASPADLAAVQAKRALAAAYDTWDDHSRRCTECAPHRLERCAERQRLADAYFDRWRAWLSATGEEARERA